ncbi:hypothetical protein phiA034_gene0010 [Aeromonas phage phiA034]|uniref:Tail assembly chaperone n=1 Tax=Aeromonas phage phiA034 TaxID=2985287 RepID=A0AAE9YIE9_9CAUD|nr:hypothetical protein phiA034_gene0010 [Aeromonas phage phiA034]
MAKLPEYSPFTETIKVRGKNGTQEIELRGLNLLDLTAIFKTHLPDLGNLAMLLDQNGGTNMTEQGLLNMSTSLVQEAPGLVASLVARAAGDPDWVDSAARLPLMAQIEAVTTIARLTFDEVGGVKKTVAALKEMVKAEGGLADLTGGKA